MGAIRVRHGLRLFFLFYGWLGLTACTSLASPAPSSVPMPSSPAAIRATQPAPSATPTGMSTPTAPAPTAPVLANPKVVVLAEGLPGPDDLLLASDGSIYLSDIVRGMIQRYTPDAGLQLVVTGLVEPEGMLFLSDGYLVIAEQGRNRLVRFNPAGKILEPFLALQNTTGQLGVDGLALDDHSAGQPTIILPDSPNGTVLRVGLDGKMMTVIARGLRRPTGAWIEPDGSLLVVEENGNSLDRLHPDGTLEKLATLPTPDDVIEDAGGNIFVNTMGDGAIHLIRADSKQDTVLVNGLSDPQGINFDPTGNLIVTDAGHHRLIKIVIR